MRGLRSTKHDLRPNYNSDRLQGQEGLHNSHLSPRTGQRDLRGNEHERTWHGRLHRLQLPSRGGTQGHEFLERALLPRGGREHLRGTRALLRV